MAVSYVGKRQQPHEPAARDEAIAQELGLRLLAALIEPFEGDEQSVCIAVG